MAVVSRASLIDTFSDGKRPNGQDFENLIDSSYNLISNAGWYYYNFIGIRTTPESWNISTFTYYGGALAGAIVGDFNPPDYYGGTPPGPRRHARAIMPIEIPRNVSKIEEFAIQSSYNTGLGTGTIDVYIYLNNVEIFNDSEEVPPPSLKVLPATSTSVDFAQSFPVPREDGSGALVDPENDSLSIEIECLLKNMSIEAQFLINKIGLRFS